MSKSKKSSLRPVLVCTEYRGVFFGYLDGQAGDPLVLRNVRCALYWDRATGGFLGLAERGPGPSCRIGARAAQVELRKITCVVEVSESAASAWESAPCVS